ncbi:MAG: hypothetical protein ACFIN6_01430 [Candidatus Walczuchella monophlebidarum]
MKYLQTHRGYSLSRGIYSCRIGNCTGDIVYAIHHYAETDGYGVVYTVKKYNPLLPNYGKRGYDGPSY